MTTPSEVDDIAADFTAMRRRVAAEISQAFRRRRAARTRREATAGMGADQRQQVTQLVRAAHADLRRPTHPRYAANVDADLVKRGLVTDAQARAAAEQRTRTVQAGKGSQQAAQRSEREPGRDSGQGSGVGAMAAGAVTAAVVAAAAEVVLSELAQLDEAAERIETSTASESQAETGPIADMTVVDKGHPHEIGEMLAGVDTNQPTPPPPSPAVAVEATVDHGLDA